ncbi:MAG: MmgE/PrpD family protein [Deltaproteobacteria bacterium]|nr:MmgE/PrpD family protein [Deltaproteobacteria bacterium]
MSGLKLAEHIADLAVKTNYNTLPAPAVAYVKTLLLDVLGSMVGTRNIESSRIARATAEELGGPSEATIVGSGRKVAAPNAAFANAIQCYGFDFVDDHNESNAHPSPATLPVSLAVGESLKLNGKELVAAIALGNELVCRLGAAFLGDMYYQGFHPTSTCGTMGATISAGKLMKLDRQQIIYAQGIAGSMVAGLMAWNSEGSYTKRLQAGHPAFCGLIAARMAQKGFNGPSDIYEGVDGVLHAYSFKDHYDTKWITEELGTRWEFTTSSTKVYPCCRYSGGHLDACLELVQKYHPDPKKIKKILVRSSKYTIHLLAEPRKWDPQNVVDCQFSMPYQSAIAFVRGKVGIDEFTEESRKDPLARKLTKYVEVVEDAEFERRYPDQYSSAVTITMEDGAQYTAVVDNPKGDKRNPVTHGDVENKFRSLVGRVFQDDARTERIIDYVNNIELSKDVGELISMVTVLAT